MLGDRAQVRQTGPSLVDLCAVASLSAYRVNIQYLQASFMADIYTVAVESAACQ